MNIEIVQQINEKERVSYTFVVFDFTLVLSRFQQQIKPDGKRTYKNVGVWDRIMGRDNTCSEPVLTEEIKQKAYEFACSKIAIGSWGEYKSNNLKPFSNENN
jgi:hypothetical protein